MKQNAAFYGIGVGPGDPELITLKAINILKKVDIVIAPVKKPGAPSLAYQIAQSYIPARTKIIFLEFPMHQNTEKLITRWNKNQEEILKLFQTHQSIGFITLGDPLFYSTYIYLFESLKLKEVSILTIPGISAPNQCAARAGIPLVKDKELLEIIPATIDNKIILEKIQSNSNLIILKAGLKLEFLKNTLYNLEHIEKAVLIVNCGMKDEQIYSDLMQIKTENISYYSTMIIKKKQ
ncbi:MAG: precorrin-2 C(20)-methyltransferase [Spirochaetes bacterium]|nr:precorrin-2 C(20)-methyltransferase [Spirochaetota bacterium]